MIRDDPLPLEVYLFDKSYRLDEPGERALGIADIAMYVHCRCGMSHEGFIARLCQELDHLNDIDPDCSK
jgi:hypothetical protein